jgi:hypothetical protein
MRRGAPATSKIENHCFEGELLVRVPSRSRSGRRPPVFIAGSDGEHFSSARRAAVKEEIAQTKASG